jgi:hypothetical protein
MEPEPQTPPTEIISALLTPDWVLIGATTQGSHHLLEGSSCQDAQAYLSINKTLLVAIADGLGTALYAQQGAQLAVQTAIHAAGDLLAAAVPARDADWLELLHQTLLETRTRLEEEAHRIGAPLADFGTTLIFVILTHDWLAAAHLGDGAVVLLDAKGDFLTILPPQNGEYANETFSLTLPDSLERVVYHVRQVNLQALGLLTDGLQRLSIHQADGSPHGPFFAPLFQQLPGISDPTKAAHSLAGFLASEKVQKLTGDDKTLILIGKPKAMV